MKKTSSQTLRLGIAAFVLGAGFGYVITGDKIAVEQLASLGERVKTVLFVKSTDTRKEG